MKKTLCILLMFSIGFLIAADIPFHRGVNISNWMTGTSVYNIQFSRYDRQDIENIRSLGCDVIRLPLSLLFFSSGDPDYTLNPLFYYFLDPIVTWAEDAGMYLILDNHTQKSGSSYVPLAKELVPLWTQLAQHYKDRSEYLLYEIMNEPHNMSAADWYLAQDSVIRAIRAVDTIHTIIAAPIWNGISLLSNFIPYDSYMKMIYSFHFYEPFIFTHQGANWADPSLVPLGGVPFPGQTGIIPACPEELVGTYVENTLLTYAENGNEQQLYEQLDRAVHFSETYDVPIFCGEFGVYWNNAPHEDRVYWHQVVTQYLEQYNIPWTIWGYKGSFGIMKKESNGLFHHDLDLNILDAMGLDRPEQDSIIIYPDTCGFLLYDEYPTRHIYPLFPFKTKNYNYYDKNGIMGTYCLAFDDPQQYGFVSFSFDPWRDLNYLKNQNASLSFYVKGNTPYTTLNFEFADKPEDGSPSHTATRTLTNHDVTWDNSWHRVTLPLNSFYPHDGFDWSRVRYLKIISNDKMIGTHFHFDDIRMILPGETVSLDPIPIPETCHIQKLYPNPFNSHFTLEYDLVQDDHVTLALYDLRGRHIITYIDGNETAGHHSLSLSGEGLCSGIYLIRLDNSTGSDIRKLIYLQ